MRCFYRSGVECTADVADLLPAVGLALGGLSGDGDALQGERLTYVRRAWERRGGNSAPPPRPVASVVLDGELLVYDEQETKAGAYDELGAKAGIQAFGTISNPNPKPKPNPNPNPNPNPEPKPKPKPKPNPSPKPNPKPNQAFGTIFWLRQSKQGAPFRYGRPW